MSTQLDTTSQPLDLSPVNVDALVQQTNNTAAPKRGRKRKTEADAAGEKKIAGVVEGANKTGVVKAKKGVKKMAQGKDAEEAPQETKKNAKKDKADSKDESQDKTSKKRTRKVKSTTNADGTPKKPKPLCSYMLFVKTVRPRVAAENPTLKCTELGKKMGEMWRALSEEEKKAYKAADPQPAAVAAQSD